ncbi:MAG: hypothetical protein SPF98_05780 [Campylobacter sp.]|nr:hypothetical protein [Campylobacter sp.]
MALFYAHSLHSHASYAEAFAPLFSGSCHKSWRKTSANAPLRHSKAYAALRTQKIAQKSIAFG